MLTDARITAIVPTTDLARAVTFYGETLGLTDSGASAPGPRVIYRCGGGTLLEVIHGLALDIPVGDAGLLGSRVLRKGQLLRTPIATRPIASQFALPGRRRCSVSHGR
jgi:hypothetical protein